jgi:hypothetical protein
MLLSDCVRFIAWIKQRLLNKHQYQNNDVVIKSLDQLSYHLSNSIGRDLTDDEWDRIIEKYYADYNMDYSEDMGLGFDKNSRYKLRNNLKNLVQDVINHNVPKDFLIKG